MSESRTPRTPRTDAAREWPIGQPPTQHERANRYLRLCYDLETLLTIAESRIAELEAECNALRAAREKGKI